MRRRVAWRAIAAVAATLAATSAGAAPFAVVTNNHDRTIHVLDLGSSPPALSGPFFTGGELGAGGTSILDVAVTPDGHYALVSNFAGDTVYRIDLSNPTSPVVSGAVALSFSPEDIAIAPDGSYALVTGGFGEPQFAELEIEPFGLEATYTLTTPGAGASCVAIGPDNRTAVLCDTGNDRVLSLLVDQGVGAIAETVHVTGSFPVNATFSPDGRTVLVADGGDDAVTVFEVTAPGTLAPGTTPSVGGLPGNQQSIAFSPGGAEAYVLSEGSSPDQVSVLDVLGPGHATLATAGAADLMGDASGAIRLGLDALAVAPAGDRLLATNPGGNGSPSDDVSVVDLTSFAVAAAMTHSDGPTAVDVFAPFAGAPPPPGATEVPTLAGWGLLALGAFLAAAALLALRPSAG